MAVDAGILQAVSCLGNQISESAHDSIQSNPIRLQHRSHLDLDSILEALTSSNRERVSCYKPSKRNEASVKDVFGSP